MGQYGVEKAAFALPSITRADRPPSVRCLVISVIQYFAASFAFHSLPSPRLLSQPTAEEFGQVAKSPSDPGQRRCLVRQHTIREIDQQMRR